VRATVLSALAATHCNLGQPDRVPIDTRDIKHCNTRCTRAPECMHMPGHGGLRSPGLIAAGPPNSHVGTGTRKCSTPGGCCPQNRTLRGRRRGSPARTLCQCGQRWIAQSPPSLHSRHRWSRPLILRHAQVRGEGQISWRERHLMPASHCREMPQNMRSCDSS
jgi:hypothetical protein